MATTVETQMIKFSDDLDPVKVERFLKRERTNTRRNVERANKGNSRYRFFKGWSERDIEECVQFMFRTYRDTLRKEIIVK